ncbi:unnamed protein product [Effrenium voratum]|uniref:Uncharacterized protein n=1 Tax=Effrenium voratum TaxID=2562239 RepID=A0AA36MKI8_9DINO|nr:unnamed protein product [Effrenium voratum]CAJ1434605.1 unnamed protein product [Effrenium voratum]
MSPARTRGFVLAACACAALWNARGFVAPPRAAAQSTAQAPSRRASPASPASPAISGTSGQPEAKGMGAVVVGLWAVAGLCAAIPRTALRAQGKEQESQVEDKKPFNVWEPDTYGNISMDDVKKYGAAGTLSYVITELLFWAIAFPTECIVYLNTAGHWPDFSKPEESAAVFGLVFAASNIARLLLPLRFGAALAMAPWVDENIMKKFFKQEAKQGS